MWKQFASLKPCTRHLPSFVSCFPQGTKAKLLRPWISLSLSTHTKLNPHERESEECCDLSGRKATVMKAKAYRHISLIATKACSLRLLIHSMETTRRISSHAT